jgi:4,5-dihydroxyphthalate decarboxylase
MTMRLRTLLGDHPGTQALKDGSLRSDLVAFDFADFSPTNRGFKPMVREQAFDVAEMAIVTYLMARSFGNRCCCCRMSWWRGINMRMRSTGPISAT